MFASLSRTAQDLSRLAGEAIVELPPRSSEYLPKALAHLERRLFEDDPVPVPLDGSIRFLEGAGRRATLELVGEEVLQLIADGTPPEAIAVVCPSVDRVRASVETAFGALGCAASRSKGERSSARRRSARHCSRCCALRGLAAAAVSSTHILRSPYSGMTRSDVDWLEGRLRGRAVTRAERTVEETTKLRNGRPLPVLELVGGDAPPLPLVRSLAEAMLRALTAWARRRSRTRRETTCALTTPSCARSGSWSG